VEVVSNLKVETINPQALALAPSPPITFCQTFPAILDTGCTGNYINANTPTSTKYLLSPASV
jgi:hypothetical protein